MKEKKMAPGISKIEKQVSSESIDRNAVFVVVSEQPCRAASDWAGAWTRAPTHTIQCWVASHCTIPLLFSWICSLRCFNVLHILSTFCLCSSFLWLTEAFDSSCSAGWSRLQLSAFFPSVLNPVNGGGRTVGLCGLWESRGPPWFLWGAQTLGERETGWGVRGGRKWDRKGQEGESETVNRGGWKG